MRPRRLIALLHLLLVPLLASPTRAAAPLRVSDNNRWLLRPDGSAFFPLIDTAWDMIGSLTREEIVTYLDDRAAKRFNIVMAVALSSSRPPSLTNVYGELPFISNNVALPNPAWFTNVDFLVDQAATRGMLVALLPSWGSHVVDTGFINLGNAQGYGEFLGARYGNKPVIFVLGGDRPATTGKLDVWRALARGIARGTTGGVEDYSQVLITYHSADNSGPYANEPWLDFHTTQSGHGAAVVASYVNIALVYNPPPPKPGMDFEANYEDHAINWNTNLGRFDAQAVRRAGYWTVLAGGCGYTYGATGVYQFHAPGRPPIFDPVLYWWDALNLPAAGQMKHLRGVFESRPLLSRVPDQTLIPTNNWSGADAIRAGRDTNGAYAMIYAPTGKPFTVQMNKLAGPDVTAWWFNPRDGSSTNSGTFTNTGFQLFSPPNTNDWLLVLDQSSQNFPPPGQTVTAPRTDPEVTLQIREQDGNAILWWLDPGTPVVLEQTELFPGAGLIPPWASVTGPTNSAGGTNEVTIPFDLDRVFFRLRRE